MKILLVDDSRTIRNIQRKVLNQLGHTDVMEAEDGLSGLKLFTEQKPDLILVDWNMPQMDGLTLVRRIREKDTAVPILMCTTEAERSKVLEALKAGVTKYIVKPFTVESLGAKIAETVTMVAGAASR